MKTLIAIDFSINGSIARFEDGVLDDVVDVPNKVLIIRPATYKFKDKDPKIVYKTGPRQGERPKVVYRKQKTKTVIDFEALKELIDSLGFSGESKVILEKVGFMRVNKGTLTKIENHGMLKGILVALGFPCEEVSASVWKKAMKVTSDKDTSMRLAHKVFDGWKFSRDDEAEAALIGQWYLKKELGE